MVKHLARVSSGIPSLDKVIEGGLVEGSINLVVGDTGTGKTVFAIQFLIEGLKKGEAGLYITFEEQRDRLYADFLEMGIDLEKYEQKGLFTVLEYTPHQIKKILTEGGGIIEAIIEKQEIKRIAIDSVTSFSLLYETELMRREAFLQLFKLMESWECTVFLVSQDEVPDDSTVYSAIEFEVDGVFVMYHAKQKGKRLRAMEVLKMKGTKIPENIFALDLSKKGITVNPKKTVSF